MPDRDPPFENLENLQEDAVLTAVQRLLPAEAARRDDLCSCRKCQVDVAAVALNGLAPRYVADRYNRFPESDDAAAKNDELVEAAVRKAIDLVGRRPHH